MSKPPQSVKDFPSRDELNCLLYHSSHVNERHRILYIETPKVACTSIKYLLRDLVDAKPLQFLPEDFQTTVTMRVHTRDQMPFPKLGSFSEKRRRQIMTDPDWFRFCLIRHPYDRFFSAWRDKIFIVEPGFEEHQRDKSKKFVEFSDFLDKALNEDPRQSDGHWRLQVSLLLPDFVNYTRIYHLAEVPDLLVDLKQHLAQQGVTDKTLVLPKINESWSISPDGFMTPDVIARLREHYRLDFERFNFPEREATATAPITAASLVNEFTDAIYDRNRLIMDHVAYFARARRVRRGARFLIREAARTKLGTEVQSLLRGTAKPAGRSAAHHFPSRPSSVDV